jgi:hypothetical protein
MVDNQGHSFTRASLLQNTAYPNNLRLEIWYVDNVTADSSYSILIHPTGLIDMVVEVVEFSGTNYAEGFSSLGGSTGGGAQTATPSLTISLRPRASIVFVMLGSPNPFPYDQQFGAVAGSTTLLNSMSVNRSVGVSAAAFLSQPDGPGTGSLLGIFATAKNTTFISLALAVSIEGKDVALNPPIPRNAYLSVYKL